MTYDIQSFYNKVAPEWGDRLWEFLNRPDIVDRMKAASDAGQPAAGAIGQHLLDEFGDPVREDIIKNFIGDLIKQVMESRGYAHYKEGSPTPPALFTEASVYRKA